MTEISILTSREREILRLLMVGKTNKEIASEICISPKTVEFHLDRIYVKIGVRTRLMAGVWALQQGLSFTADVFPDQFVDLDFLVNNKWGCTTTVTGSACPVTVCLFIKECIRQCFVNRHLFPRIISI